MRISDWSSDVCSSDLPRIATLLARSREEEPELEIRVFELPFAQQLKMLHDDLLDIGFALSNAVHDGLVAEPVWTDPLSVIVHARHPLLAHVQVPLPEALKFPLVLCHPEARSAERRVGNECVSRCRSGGALEH